MAKKPRHKNAPVRSRRSRVPWLVVAVVVVLIVVIGVARVVGRPSPRTSTPTSGGPRLAVDQTTIDAGRVKFGTPVKTTFRLSNVGDQPIQMLGEPQVELITGC